MRSVEFGRKGGEARDQRTVSLIVAEPYVMVCLQWQHVLDPLIVVYSG